MHVKLISIGKLKSGPEKELVDDYTTRFNKAGPNIGLRSLKLIDLASGGGLDVEGERLLGAVPSGATVIRLDEHGPQLTSVKFSKRLAKLRDQGTSELCFLIGGAEGYSPAVRTACPDTLALGPQTWPHRLVKVMIAEQLYRVVSLLAGSPYHKA
ncbi:MAG: 23S rRNA (pseudouridine(1915)-N(3))-methyltransferase RlmH [Hyphomonadaceae bacterium]|nr:23S rRNA (pseudouridine(1915)-N(3))-methyltransferase RlmH [Hyphomonadaceae bacterium]